jgi:predicted Zn-dependent peptidase
MLDRTIAPPFSLPSEFYMLEATKQVLKNGIPIYSIHAGSQSLLRIEFIFYTGYCREIPHGKTFGGKEPYMGTSYFTAKMMSEGTKNFTSQQFYERLAQYGIFYEVDHEPYHTFFTFYVLKKYLKQVLPLIQEVFEKAIFPANEWETIKKLTLQKLKIDLSKNDFIANRVFYETIFGKNHPAGKHIEESIVHQISIQDLIDFYQEEIKDKLFDVIVAGACDEEVRKIVSDFFENAPLVHPTSYSSNSIPKPSFSSNPIFIEKN